MHVEHTIHRLITFATFCEIVECLSLSDRDVRREIEESFRVLDAEGKGYLTAAHLKTFCKDAGEYMPESELRHMITEANVSGSGRVTLEEFLRVMLRTNIYR